jgi:hypothetical protein
MYVTFCIQGSRSATKIQRNMIFLSLFTSAWYCDHQYVNLKKIVAINNLKKNVAVKQSNISACAPKTIKWHIRNYNHIGNEAI